MKKLFLILITVFISPFSAFANGSGDGHMGGGGHLMDFGYGGAFMWIIFLIVIGVVIYFIIQSTKSKTLGNATGETPLDVLKKRYANGEISKEKFEEMKRDLGS